jgi:uncharacterized membrane protein YjgN (DUF898 family)
MTLDPTATTLEPAATTLEPAATTLEPAATTSPEPSGTSLSPPEAAPPLSFAFTGTAGEYFRIWIVNLLLSVATLGLWSPWAKVRKRRYFYGHTWVAGANFDYHGDPIAILRGRLLAAVAFAVYWFFHNLQPISGPFLLLALLMGAPWIVARSLAFNAANSSHRGLRFAFDGDARRVARAIWPLFLWPLLVWVSQRDPIAVVERPLVYAAWAGVVYLAMLALYPYAVARVRRLTVGCARWGQCAFSSDLATRRVYAIYGIAAILVGIGVAVLGAGIALTLAAAGMFGNDLSVRIFLTVAPVAFAIVYGVFAIVAVAYTRSRVGNLVLNTARLGNIGSFRSTLSARRLARLYAVNLLAVLVSAGLLIPWAAIRVARYRAQCVTLLPAGNIDAVAAGVVAAPAATGEELADAFGFDLAL